MSRGRRTRGRRAGRPVSGGLLAWLLSLPARLHLRWLVILVVTVAVMGAYARVLVTASPMPPGKAPAAGAQQEHSSATPHVGHASRPR
ncbi:hypothetical protein [Streptomyces sp. 142MFCol3.1]|uniref:hypothetical protein n=1 Tax=Streptomyces sp. 142MFCol3.1 TaxID=1172179 RepID=UPI001319BBBA|nr:hypothetical protein [Streptomyces sp. 142MFCol3.1]